MFEYFNCGDLIFFVMEYCNGGNLLEYRKKLPNGIIE